MSDEVETKLKSVVDDSAAAEMDRLAQATAKAARAEDDLQRLLKQRAGIVRELVRLDATRPGGVIDRMGGETGVPGGGMDLRLAAARSRAGRRCRVRSGSPGGLPGGPPVGGGANWSKGWPAGWASPRRP